MGPWVAVIFCAARPLFGGEPLLDVDGWPIFDARLSGGRLWVNAFCCDRSDESLLDGRKTSKTAQDEILLAC